VPALGEARPSAESVRPADMPGSRPSAGQRVESSLQRPALRAWAGSLAFRPYRPISASGGSAEAAIAAARALMSLAAYAGVTDSADFLGSRLDCAAARCDRSRYREGLPIQVVIAAEF
jgi:hypothetical protein